MQLPVWHPALQKTQSLPLWHPAYLAARAVYVEKGWVTLKNGHHIYLGDEQGHGQQGKGGGGGSFSYEAQAGLSGRERGVEHKFGEQIRNNPEKAIKDYKKQFGKVLNPDNAKMLSKDYQKNPTANSRAVHEPASALTKEMYNRALKAPAKAGERRVVLFTAGGGGAGKTAAINDVGSLRKIAGSSKIVYDSVMGKYGSAKQKIDQALQAGHKVVFAYVNRSPAEAMINGVVPRAQRTGRVVPLNDFVQGHVGAATTFAQLQDTYKNNPHVAFVALDNNHGKGGAQLMDVASVKHLGYTVPTVTTQVNAALEGGYQSGKISSAIYNGIKGE